MSAIASVAFYWRWGSGDAGGGMPCRDSLPKKDPSAVVMRRCVSSPASSRRR